MAKITIPGASTMEVPSLPDPGTYIVRCMKAVERDNAMRLDFIIVDGPDQKNGESAAGTRLSDFIQTSGYESHRDGGAFARQRIASVLAAFEVDPDGDEIDTEDFEGAEVRVVVQHRKDNNGITRANIRHYFFGEDAEDAIVD